MQPGLVAPSDRCLSSLLSIFVRFQSRKMNRNIQGGDGRRVGLESFIDSVPSVIWWNMITDRGFIDIRACSRETFRDIRHDENMLFYKIDLTHFVQRSSFFFFRAISSLNSFFDKLYIYRVMTKFLKNCICTCY